MYVHPVREFAYANNADIGSMIVRHRYERTDVGPAA